MATRKRLPKAERQQQIVDFALTHLAAHGARGLTLRVIATALGVTDASLLRHFPSKQAIIEAAVDRFGTLLAGDLPASDDPSMPPLVRLGHFVERRLQTARTHPALIELAFNTRLADAAPDLRARIDANMRPSLGVLRTCIMQAQVQGSISATVSVQAWIWVIMGFVRGASRQAEMSPADAWTMLRQVLVGQADLPD